jgi:hypothetical protein
MPNDLNDPQQRREFRRHLSHTGLDQVRHLVAMRNHYNSAKQTVAEQWLKDVESGAIVEDDLREIIEGLEALKPKYVNGGNMTGLFLRHEDEATALRLYTETMALLDQRFGKGNQQSRQLAHTINNGSGGFASDGPSLACLTSTIELIRGFVRISERMPRSSAPSLPPPEPQPGDYPLEQLPSYSSFHLRGLSDDDLARYVAGWKSGTENHIIGMRELERRKTMARTPSSMIETGPSKRSYIDPARLAEIEALQSVKWDFCRLAQLCRELNAAFGDGHYITTAALVRIVMDHVPPLFGFNDFDQIAANYGGPKAHKSFKKSMTHLQQSMRNISDAQIHSHIRPTDALPNSTQVDVKGDLDVLLAEVIRIGKSS